MLCVSDIGEFALIKRIKELTDSLNNKSERILVDSGDDTAAFTPRPGYEILITCDTMVEGRHYLKEYFTPFETGRRAMVMNISDIGAMGGMPVYAFISLGLNPSMPVIDMENIYKGFIHELAPFNAGIIGGNITRTDGPAFINVTLTGEILKKDIVSRSGAEPGDAVLVTGYPGQAALGYRILIDNDIHDKSPYNTLLDSYIRPDHRAVQGMALAESGMLSSMIDLSDGLSADLNHILEDSDTGVEIYSEMFPVCTLLEKTADYYRLDKYSLILGASDDYELIFTCRPENTGKVEKILADLSCPVSRIGRILDPEKGKRIVFKDGTSKELLTEGWDHFSK